MTDKDAPKMRRLGVVDGWVLRIELCLTRGEADAVAMLEGALPRRGVPEKSLN